MAEEATADVARENDDLTTALENADAAYQELLIQTNLSDAESDRLRHDLNAIYSSRSWKFMALQRKLRLR